MTKRRKVNALVHFVTLCCCAWLVGRIYREVSWNGLRSMLVGPHFGCFNRESPQVSRRVLITR